MVKNKKILSKNKIVKSVSNKRSIRKLGIKDFSSIFLHDKLIKFTIFTFSIILLSVFINISEKNKLAASVNGEKITKVKYYSELVKRDNQEVLDNLITKSIIYQESEKLGIKIPQSVIDEEISKIEKEISSQGANLDSLLASRGLDYSDLIENIKIEKILEKILGNQIEISEDEIKQRFESQRDFYDKNSTLEDVKDDLKLQLYREKIVNKYQEWISQKKGEYKIYKYL